MKTPTASSATSSQKEQTSLLSQQQFAGGRCHEIGMERVARAVIEHARLA